MITMGELVLRLILATIIGGVIGFEREISNRPAGFRTHILVTLGSCLIMIVSIYGFIGFGDGGHGGEPSRLAAQVVSGIGILGAGTILREGTNIKGLTTAASLWISGGIGLTIGIGFYTAALVTTGLSLFSLIILRVVEGSILKNKKYTIIKVSAIDRLGLLGEISSVMASHKVDIRNISMEASTTDDEADTYTSIIFYAKLPSKIELHQLHDDLSLVEGITNIIWNDKEVFISKGRTLI
ncbi:MgtC/SapB family protein [Alkaliphilus serpentinus]|uniref:MgtC/SapB family protein n=1 Tax=Alkaliphilus serpentinus TaxID=1482731 RepID=A0A833MCE6_9FIRM|nr:MgtC/SapB family protein [Alkaliphilus serpentinus]KAB3524829.1 MgtC/SapB family protein [Alkaliphilus serpentinus]